MLRHDLPHVEILHVVVVENVVFQHDRDQRRAVGHAVTADFLYLVVELAAAAFRLE